MDPDQLKERSGLNHGVTIGGVKGYITANYSEEWDLYEVFVHGFGKLGSTMEGWTNSFCILLSLGLQNGTDLAQLAPRFATMRFEPNGDTDNPNIPYCYSVPDYIFRWLVHHFGNSKLKSELAAIHADMKRD